MALLIKRFLIKRKVIVNLDLFFSFLFYSCSSIFFLFSFTVVVQGLPGIPPIDLESVLFLDNGNKMLGKVFDVFGQVHEPLYVVRFNSSDHVKEHQIQTGQSVFFAPKTDYTKTVVVSDLMRYAAYHKLYLCVGLPFRILDLASCNKLFLCVRLDLLEFEI